MMYVCECAHVFKITERNSLLTLGVLNKRFPQSRKENKDLCQDLWISSLYLQIYHNNLCSFIRTQDIWTISTPNVQLLMYNSLLTIVKLTKQISLTTYWHQLIKMTIG